MVLLSGRRLTCSVFQEKHPLYIPSRSEIVEYASRKEEEGDIYFNLGKHLRAHRRYFKARQIIAYSRFGVRSGEFNLIKLLSIPTSEIDAQLEEMWISSTFKAAKCAIQLGCCKQASDYYGEVIKFYYVKKISRGRAYTCSRSYNYSSTNQQFSRKPRINPYY